MLKVASFFFCCKVKAELCIAVMVISLILLVLLTLSLNTVNTDLLVILL